MNYRVNMLKTVLGSILLVTMLGANVRLHAGFGLTSRWVPTVPALGTRGISLPESFNTENARRGLWILGGAAATGFAAYGAYRLYNWACERLQAQNATPTGDNFLVARSAPTTVQQDSVVQESDQTAISLLTNTDISGVGLTDLSKFAQDQDPSDKSQLELDSSVLDPMSQTSYQPRATDQINQAGTFTSYEDQQQAINQDTNYIPNLNDPLMQSTIIEPFGGSSSQSHDNNAAASALLKSVVLPPYKSPVDNKKQLSIVKNDNVKKKKSREDSYAAWKQKRAAQNDQKNNTQQSKQLSPLIDQANRAVSLSEILNQEVVQTYAQKCVEACKSLGQDLTPQQIYTWIAKGGYYAHQLFNGDVSNIPTQTREKYLDSIISLTWYFYSLAINKHEQFEEGTFMIVDQNWHINDFLENYVKRFNPKFEKSTAGATGSNSPIAYARKSSHLKHVQKEHKHFGIDIRFGVKKWTEPILPAQKRHILFGKVPGDSNTPDRLFFKMENYGLYATDGLWQHGGELLHAWGRKAASRIFGSDDAETYRKERVPEELMVKVKELFAKVLSQDEYKHLANATKMHGFAALYQYVKNWEQKERSQRPGMSAWRDRVRSYVNEKINEYDNFSIRMGREVIINPIDQDTLLAGYYYTALLKLECAQEVAGLRAQCEAVIAQRAESLFQKQDDPCVLSAIINSGTSDNVVGDGDELDGFVIVEPEDQ